MRQEQVRLRRALLLLSALSASIGCAEGNDNGSPASVANGGVPSSTGGPPRIVRPEPVVSTAETP
jgi:hypothetical protein